MEFEKVVMGRYAVKKFDGKKVPEERVNKLKELIRYSPSSYNIQPWKIKIVTDQATKEKLAPVSWNQLQITTCSHLLVFCADKDVAGNIDRLEKLMIKNGMDAAGAKQYADMMRSFEKGMDDQKKACMGSKTGLSCSRQCIKRVKSARNRFLPNGRI